MKDEVVAHSEHEDSEREYHQFLRDFQDNFDSNLFSNDYLFTTDVENLFDVFLSKIPEERRQHYNCHACRDFVNKYGGLVKIDENGRTLPIMWNTTSFPILNLSIEAIRSKLSNAWVNGVFKSDQEILGKPITGKWHHMSIKLPKLYNFVNDSLIHTAGQWRSQKREDFRALMISLSEYPKNIADQAVSLLNTESLPRSDRFLATAIWFAGIHKRLENCKVKNIRRNIVWKAVTSVPNGVCHIKSSVIGTLLDDLKDGKSYDVLRRKFAVKVDSINYQRPKSSPSDGNIEQAEKIIEQLGLKDSLARRLAKFEDLQYIWLPESIARDDSGTGVFSHLKKNNITPNKITTNSLKITWEKFQKNILPDAKAIEIFINQMDNFSAFTTAANPDAPPIIRWDKEENRNPVAWYQYAGGSSSGQWGLESHSWLEVIGICELPSMWNDNKVSERGAAFIIKGARDSRYGQLGIALFPEFMISELHGIRSTIESYSRNEKFIGDNVDSVAGIMFHKGNKNISIKLKIETNNVAVVYEIDRWD